MTHLEALIKELSLVDLQDEEQFAPILNRAMERLDLNIEQIAHQFDISRPSVFRWRSGLSAPHPSIRKHVYAFLLKNAEELWDGNEK